VEVALLRLLKILKSTGFLNSTFVNRHSSFHKGGDMLIVGELINASRKKIGAAIDKTYFGKQYLKAVRSDSIVKSHHKDFDIIRKTLKSISKWE
jgi:hypothetical protein